MRTTVTAATLLYYHRWVQRAYGQFEFERYSIMREKHRVRDVLTQVSIMIHSNMY